MTNKLDESIIFLNNFLKDKDDYVLEVIQNVNIPLKKSCIEIAKKLKDYDRPIKEQLLGLFCLCYGMFRSRYHRYIGPEQARPSV